MAQTPLASALDTFRDPACQVEVAWDGATYVDETAHVRSMSRTSQLSADSAGPSALGSLIADSCRVVLHNGASNGYRFSPNNPASALYGTIGYPAAPGNVGGYLRPIRVSLGFSGGSGGGLLRVFTGVIVNPNERWADRSVELHCLDRWHTLREKRVSTGLFTGKWAHEAIQESLTASGLGYASSLAVSSRLIDYTWHDDDPVADEIERVVVVAGGLGYFRYDGTFVFKDGSWPAFAQAPVAQGTFTTANFAELEPEWDFTNVFGTVTARVQPLMPGLPADVWELDRDLAIPPGGTEVLTPQFRNPLLALVTPAYSQVEAESDWAARTSAGQPLETGTASQVTVTLSGVLAQRCTLTLVNTNATRRAFVTKLRLRGQPLVPGRESEVTAGSGGRTLKLDNVYFQDPIHARSVCEMARIKHRLPRQTVALVGVPGRPHLEVTDRVRVTETITGIDRDFYVARIEDRYDGAYTQDLALIDTRDSVEYVNYHVVGTSTYGDGGVSGSGRAWY